MHGSSGTFDLESGMRILFSHSHKYCTITALKQFEETIVQQCGVRGGETLVDNPQSDFIMKGLGRKWLQEPLENTWRNKKKGAPGMSL